MTKIVKTNVSTRDGSTTVSVSWPVDVSRVVAVIPTYTCHEISDRIVVSDWSAEGITLRAGAAQSVDFSLFVLRVIPYPMTSATAARPSSARESSPSRLARRSR